MDAFTSTFFGCRVRDEMLMNGFGPNVELSEKGKVQYRRSAKLSCSNFENVTAGKQRTPKTVKLVDLVKRFPRNT